MPGKQFPFTRPLKFRKLASPLARAIPLMLIAALLASTVQAAAEINTVDNGGDVSETSLVLDGSGFPVISYYDNTNSDLKLAHCNDANCAGGDESLVTVDSGGDDDVGRYSSLALDSSGFPVISYSDNTNTDLKLAHCNDVNCAGEDESIIAVESAGFVGWWTSLALDSSGFPVVSYYDLVNGALKLAHCNDPNCVGGDESLVSIDSAGVVGGYSSLVLDSSGNPVISYNDSTNGSLKLAHCDDANCAGGNESLNTVDSGGSVGLHTSLTLDGSGFPVVSYWDYGTFDLKLAHCNDANCAGGDESLVTVDSEEFVGAYSSLALDGSGFPVISYSDSTNGDLRLAHCNDANCVGGGENLVSVDSAGSVGLYTSLVLDSSGFPVISYSGSLKLAHCDQANCGVSVPEMDVRGNGRSIADGDLTPSTDDHTEFEDAALQGETVTRTFTIRNTGTADLILTDSPRVTIEGVHAADFALTIDAGTPIAAAGQTTFQITFDPSAAGLRQATVSIANNDANEDPYNFSIQGTGASPSIYLPIVMND